MKKVLILSASPRKSGNSDILCDRFAAGAKENGNTVEKIFLADRNIGFCRGCSACSRTRKCVQRDDMAEILDKMTAADVIVLATPVYFYSEISGKDFYCIFTAADTDRAMLERTVETFRGVTEDCLDGAREAGVLYGTGAWNIGEIKKTPAYNEAYKMGRKV